MKENTLQLAAPWPQVKELLKEVNSDLSDEDLERISELIEKARKDGSR